MSPEEIIARAICAGDWRRRYPRAMADSVAAHVSVFWRNYIPSAQAVLSALSDAGMVIVPKEPTGVMIEASVTAIKDHLRSLNMDERILSTRIRFSKSVAWIGTAEKHALRYRAMISAGEGET